MPPRPSKSPAKARSASPKPVKTPTTAKSPAKATKATPKSTKAAATEAKAEPAAEEVEETVEETAPAHASAAPASVPASAPAAPKPKGGSSAAMATGVIGVVVAALAVAYSFMSAKPPEPIGWVSAKSFDGTTLKMKGASSAMLVFMTRLEECELCGALKAELSDEGFLRAAEGWKKQNLLKIGKVKCWKNEELCREMGVAGDEPDAAGYPHILHFKGGKSVGSVDARTAVGLQEWVAGKQAAGVL